MTQRYLLLRRSTTVVIITYTYKVECHALDQVAL